MNVILTHWHCSRCDVSGRDDGPEPSCWNCGGVVVVTSRPSVDGDAPPPYLSW